MSRSSPPLAANLPAPHPGHRFPPGGQPDGQLGRLIGITLGIMLPLAAGPGIGLAQDRNPELPAITVTGASDARTTEGTRSYTTGVMNSATGLGLSIRETPQSVSVVTREAMQDRGIVTAADAALAAPGITALSSDSNRLAFSARGFAIDSFQFDGLPHPILGQWNFGDTDLDTALIDHVEVVRGATGLLTGSGHPSAAINFVRKRPLRNFAASAGASVGTWGTRRIEADVSVPLTDDGRIRARLVGARTRQGSHVTFLETDRTALYGVVTADLTSRTSVTAGFEYQDTDSTGMGSGFPLFYSDGTRTRFDRSVANNAPWALMETDWRTAFADLQHRLDSGWRLRAALSHSDGHYRMKHVYRGGYPDATTGLGMSGTAFNFYDGDRTREAVHLGATGPLNAFGRTHELSFGWMLLEDRVDIGRRGPAGAAPVPGSFFDWHSGSVAEPVWSDTVTVADRVRNRQSGFYGVGRFSIADPLHLIVGARVSNWKTDQNYFGALRQYDYSNEVTPYAGLVYDLDAVHAAYVSYTSIFAPQNAREASGAILPPVTGASYEAGVKGEYLQGRLNAALAIFESRQNDLAQAIPGESVIGMPGTPAYRPADGAKVRGIELEAVGALTPRWNFSAGLTHFNADDATGQRINTTHPRTVLKLFSTYRPDGPLEGLTLGGGLHWQGGIQSTAPSPLGPVKVEQGSYLRLDLMARYQFAPRWALSVHVYNALDRTYYDQIGFFSQGWYGKPRHGVVALSARF